MSTIWNPPDWRQKLAEFEAQWAQVSPNPYTNKGAATPWKGSTPKMHPDWKLEWTAVDKLKVVNLLKAGVDVRWYSVKQGAKFDQSLPAMPLTYYGEAWAGLPDMTCGLILQNYGDDTRFVVRTE